VASSLVELALRCYPQWWNERYGDEMRAVIDDLKIEGRSETRIAIGLLRDAIRSRLQARGMPRTYGLLASRTRTSVATGTLPWMAIVPFVLFIVGRFTLHSSSGAVETGYPFQLTGFRTRVVSEPSVHWVHPSISTSTWVAGISTMVMDGLYLITFLVLAVGLSALRNGIVREKGTNRRSMYLLTWVPVATVVLIIVLDVAQSLLNDGSHPHQLINGQTVFLGGHTAVAALMGNFMWMVGIVGWLLSLFGLAIVAKRVNLPPETLRLGRTVSVLTSLSLIVTFVAFVVWGAAVDVQNNQTHVAGAIVATYPRFDLWIPMTVALGIASVVSIYGATTARRSWRTIYLQRLWDT
jgi:hypothetical protein